MPGALVHSPADILARLLVELGVGVLSPGTRTEWPISIDNEPTDPDNVITVYNVMGQKNGRTQFDGEIQEYHGIQLRVRGATSSVMYTKARALAIIIDQTILNNGITIAGTRYCVHNVSRQGDIIPIGKDASTPTKRSICTINCLMVVRTLSCD
jgi:hypothetical protein